MVVLVALISFAGYYFTIKNVGTRRGVVFAGLFGGLASSTALTLQFSRMSRGEDSVAYMLAMDILLTCETMLLRMALIASI